MGLETLMPMFREYLCDLWYVCDGGALVQCHHLLVMALLNQGEMNLSLLNDCSDEDCYVSLEGWPPEKLALELYNAYICQPLKFQSYKTFSNVLITVLSRHCTILQTR